jgi:MAP/microtubule affinity-regulating kinase
MSTDCETLLKKFLVLNPTRRSPLEVRISLRIIAISKSIVLFLFKIIMKDKWMNVNYENDELKPYEEPSQDFNDNYRIGKFLFD